VTVGIVHHSGGVTINPAAHFGHNHPVTRLAIILHGKPIITRDQREYLLTPGCGILLPGRKPARIPSGSMAAPGPLTYVYIDLHASAPLLSVLVSPHHQPIWQTPHPVLASIGAHVQHVLRNDGDLTTPALRASTARCLESLVATLLRLSPPPQQARSNQMVRTAALDIVQQHHCDPSLTPAVVAEHLGISVRSLQRAFACDGGGSDSRQGGPGRRIHLTDHIARCRLDSALSVLRDQRYGGLSVDAVARRCGFGSTVVLRRQVLAATGCTPTGLRNCTNVAAGQRA
jgi:AraC-like DNA-binding protein